MKCKSKPVRKMSDPMPENIICGKYVNLLNDVAFKWVFAREANKDLLIALLNELIPELHIMSLEFYKNTRQSYAEDLKDSVFDVACRLADGRQIDIEVQVRAQDWFADRCLYYSTYCIQDMVQRGQKDSPKASRPGLPGRASLQRWNRA